MKNCLYALALASAVGLASTAFAVAPAFEKVDADQDGRISKAEAAQIEGLDFAKADANKDGSLDRREYAAAVG